MPRIMALVTYDLCLLLLYSLVSLQQRVSYVYIQKIGKGAGCERSERVQAVRGALRVYNLLLTLDSFFASV